MEAIHSYRTKIKKIKHLPRQAAPPVWLVSMRWSSLQAVVDIAKLQFMCCRLLLTMSSVYMVVMIKRVYSILQSNTITKGHTATIVTICQRYNLMWRVIDALESDRYDQGRV